MLVSIVIGGMIGLGKTSVADTLNVHFKHKELKARFFMRQWMIIRFSHFIMN